MTTNRRDFLSAAVTAAGAALTPELPPQWNSAPRLLNRTASKLLP
jgi:hypothetical protein